MPFARPVAAAEWRFGMLGLPVTALILLGVFCFSVQARDFMEPITNASDVLELSATEALRGLPVELQGVVISESEPREHALILADDTSGIYVLAETNLFAPFHSGDLLEISGVTDPGQFAPILKAKQVKKIGTAPLPQPRRVTYHQLITGAMDAQWVEVSGVVQQLVPPAPGSQICRMLLAVDGGLLHVRMTNPLDPEIKEDAEVRLRAICFYQFNQKRQLLSPVLQIPPGMPIAVEKAAPENPYDAPVRPAGSLLIYSRGVSFGHRVHVRGVVMHSQPGSLVWIRDESSGLRLQTRSPETVQPGDIVDALGFPKYGSATPVLEDAVFRKLGTTNAPAPLLLPDPFAAFNHEDNLVSIEARLSDVTPVAEGLELTMEAANVVFKAMLRGAARQPLWQPNSEVRATGICSVIYDEARPVMGIWHPQSIRLLLRSPEDIAILKAPSWWTLGHVVYLLAAVAAVLLLTVGVVFLLGHKRLREQQLHRSMAETEFAAILSERNRMAREIHDTLAQGLTAISIQLRLARKRASGVSPELTEHLDAAQQLAGASLAEARNSIWNMRAQVLETSDLADALQGILTRMTDGAECKTEFKVNGNPRRLSPLIENNLLRVGQEAITNAVRHGKAGHISMELDFGEKRFQLCVRDDGCGFDSSRPARSEAGFGLVGMRERARKLNGELTISSSPGKGAEVLLTVPLAG